MGNRSKYLLRATLLLMTILLGFGQIITSSPLFAFPAMFRPRKYSFLTILLQIQHFWRWEGVLRSPVLLIIITQRLELPAFAFSFPLSSVSATGRHNVQQLLLNTGCMKYPMERRNEKCLKNFRICKCKKFRETYKLSFKMH